jgi:dTDP-glucose 4,6-dehydratase
MNILITGGLGFIGSNFIINILENYPQHTIVNIDSETDGSNHDNLGKYEKSEKYHFVKGSITDYNLMKNLISDCDAIINFAAHSHVDRSIENAAPFVDSNISGVFTILEILKNQKKRFLHISTDEVFGSLSTETADENFRFNPSSPYSATKASAELLINSYCITYGINATISRCSNNYGPRQYVEKLIPKTIILAESNHKIPVYNNGAGIRDWIYVSDHCDALYTLLEKGLSGESYNISSSDEINVITVVKTILDIMNKPHDLISFAGDRPGHDQRYSMSSNKLRNNFSFKPKISFDDGLKKTITWYIENKNWWKQIDLSSLTEGEWKKYFQF